LKLVLLLLLLFGCVVVVVVVAGTCGAQLAFRVCLFSC